MSDQTNGQVRDEQRVRTFNPNDHLIQLKTREGYKDYLPVQWRLVWFREQCPQGTIETEELIVDLDREVEEEAFVWNNEKRRSEKTIKKGRGYARYRAVVTDGKGGRATGIKTENAASFPDYAEKAETGAIGRALAALGYGTQFAPDLDEAHRIVDSPVDRQQASTPNNSAAKPAVPATASNQVAQAAPTRPIPSTNATNNNANSNAGTNSARTADNEASASATEQQLASIRKLSEHLGKPLPEEKGLSFLGAKKVIQQLTAEYREQRQNNKAS